MGHICCELHQSWCLVDKYNLEHKYVDIPHLDFYMLVDSLGKVHILYTLAPQQYTVVLKYKIQYTIYAILYFYTTLLILYVKFHKIS